MTDKELSNAVSAVLFASGEPVSIQRLSQTFDVSVQEITDAAKMLCESFKDSPFELLTLENTYQMCTKKEYAEYIKRAFDIKRKTPLSQAGLEVLAVVAYNQPVTKAFVEQVRGVDCSGVMQTLIEKELIEERGRLELPGRPLLYGTTKNFLRCFSMSDLSDLPNLPEKETGTVPDVAEQLKADLNINDDTEEV